MVACAKAGSVRAAATIAEPAMAAPRDRRARFLVSFARILTPAAIILQANALTRADNDARERIVGDDNGNAGHLAEPSIEAAQQGAPARQDHATVDDIRGELRWCLLEHCLHRIDDRLNRLGERFANLLARDLHRARQAIDKVAPANLHDELGL